MPKYFANNTNSCKNCCFSLSLLIFDTNLYSNSLQKWVLEEAPSRVPYRSFCTHFFDVAKKAAPERFYISSPATSASKKPSEKSAKKLVRRSLLSDFTYLVLMYFNRVRFAKNKIPNSIPHNWCQQKWVPERPAPTR